jgi:hypothetical protein
MKSQATPSMSLSAFSILLRFAYFVSFYVCSPDVKATADELNPLTISHTAKTISCTAIGRFKTT